MPPREQITVRLDTEELAIIRDLAARETEDSNVSQMVRKLLGDALRTRAAKEGGNDTWKDRSE